MLKISDKVSIPLDDIQISAIRAQGAGGQHVNKSATAIHLRFDVRASTLPDYYKRRLLKLTDRRITRDGVIVIKSQEHRSQDRNRETALGRLREMIQKAGQRRKTRVATRPSKASSERRLASKDRRGRLKQLRGRRPDVE